MNGLPRYRRSIAACVAAVSVAAAIAAAAQSSRPVEGLIISGRQSPPPNASGWSNTDVIVSFECAGPGKITCPPPVVITEEGARDVSGQASSDTGATASTSVHVQIDKIAPAVVITSPALGALVAPGQLTITGTSFDRLSGLTAVTCNNQPAVVDAGSFKCSVTVPRSMSSITVRATDAASNLRSSVMFVATTETAASIPPTALRLSPQQVTMPIGGTRRFSVTDNLGRHPADAVWTIDRAGVATLATTPQVTVTAEAVGDVTLTASWQGLEATTHVRVLAVIPLGTPLWSVTAIGGGTVREIVPGPTAPDGIARTYVVSGTGRANTVDTISAFDDDGRELWSVSAGGLVTRLVLAPGGGVLAQVGALGFRAFSPSGAPLPGLSESTRQRRPR
jgi:hypothetical protein